MPWGSTGLIAQNFPECGIADSEIIGRMSGLLDSSPLLGKPDSYHEDVPSGQELNDDSGLMDMVITDTASKGEPAMEDVN